MVVYRLCNERYAGKLDGEGARKYGGRWNSPGVAVVYTASSVSLAVLETRVHLRTPPISYVLLAIQIDTSLAIQQTVDPRTLPIGWQSNIDVTRHIGDSIFTSTESLYLYVPSVVVSGEWNILFSDRFASTNAKIVEKTLFEFDT